MTRDDEGPMIRREDWGITHRDLMCEPHSIEYDFKSRLGVLRMADGDCCDMTGCINVFMRMDQEVSKILTYSGDKPETVYVKRSDGEWRAIP